MLIIVCLHSSSVYFKFCVFQVLCVLGFGFGSYIVWFSILVLSFGSQFWFLVWFSVLVLSLVLGFGGSRFWFLVLLSVLVLSLVLGFGS